MSAPASAPEAPSADELLGDAYEAVLADCVHHTGPRPRITRVTGGNVSHVFRVAGPTGRVILKIRGRRFARIPELATSPDLIADEHRALQVYWRAAADLFPRILAFHPRAHAMVMTDVFPDGRTYQDQLIARPATEPEMIRLGQALRRIHDATRDEPGPIRSQGDVWFRDHTFDFCLRAGGHPALEQLCRDLAALPDQQLIYGDFAPKNISLAGARLAVCDLDNVHRGWPLYDLGYLTAHIMLHHLGRPGALARLVPALRRAYLRGGDQHDRDLPAHLETLLAQVTAGVLLYRLTCAIVPYPLPGSVRARHRLTAALHRELDGPLTTLSLTGAVANVA